MLNLFLFIVGTIFGSFLNVLIYRLPRRMDIVFLSSHCTNCNKRINWYNNIPILSYLLLKGRCSSCTKKINIRYPIVEFITGVFIILIFPNTFSHGLILKFIMNFTIGCILLVHFFIDIDHKILPDVLNIYLAIIFIFYGIFFQPLLHWILGGLIGLLFPLTISWVFYLIRKQIGLGGGDIKLYASLGLYLGPVGILHNFFLSCLLGSIFGITMIILKKMNRNTTIPFGPFIIIVAIIQIFTPFALQL